MTKQEIASYLVDLITIMESKEDAGVKRGATLGREYTRHYDELTQLIKEDEENEAGKRIIESGPTQAGASDAAGEPWRGGSVGSSLGHPASDNTAVR